MSPGRFEAAVERALTAVSGTRPAASPAQQPSEVKLAADLRAALAVRGWVNPRQLLPPNLDEGIRTGTLNAVAADVETSFRQYPGRWYLSAPVRRRVIANADPDALRSELGRSRYAGVDDDPLLRAFRRLLGLDPLDLRHCSIEELQAIENASDWLGGQRADLTAIRDEAIALAMRRKRDVEIERLTGTTLIGRKDALDALSAFLSAPFRKTASLSTTYVYGIGGAGKSTLLAHLEKRLAGASRPFVIHLDFDRADLDPSDPLSLDLALLAQLSVAVPRMAETCRTLSQALGEAGLRLRADKADSLGLRARARRPAARRKSAQAKVRGHSLELESAQTREKSERDSILFHCLNPLYSSTEPHPRPLAIILDTLEVVFARGTSAISDLTQWLDSLVRIVGAKDVRVILAGRDPLPEDPHRNICARLSQLGYENSPPIALPDLDEKQAVALLIDAGLKNKQVARAAAKALPGNPLVLRMAADIHARAPEALDEIRQAYESGRIDRITAGRYLAERVVAHLSDPAAQPYVLAAMALPKVDEQLIRAIVLPVVDGAAADTPPDGRKAKRVYGALVAAGWLVVPSLDGLSFTYHPELRALVQKLIEADPDKARQQAEIRAAAIAWHGGRRSRQDRAFALYHRLMQGDAVHPDDNDLIPLLGRFLDDLPPQARQALTEQGGDHVEAAQEQPSEPEWKAYVEGDGRRDGQGDKLVKRGRADEALALYRKRPTRENGIPPTFVIQALADSGEWDTRDVDLGRLLAEIESALPVGGRMPGVLLSRIYWVTRYEMLRHPQPLSAPHLRLLRKVGTALTTGTMAIPPLIAIAEALSDVRIAPAGWLAKKGALSDTRLHLVHALHNKHSFKVTVNLDAVAVTQRGWSKQIERFGETIVAPGKRFQLAERSLVELDGARYPEVSYALRSLRKPVAIDYSPEDPASVILLLRSMTIELHRPLRSTLAAALEEAGLPGRKLFAPIWRAIERTRDEMTICPKEFAPDMLEGMVVADPLEWFGSLVAYADRSRLLPALCKRLIRLAAKTRAQRRLRRVAAAFEAWDRALCAGGSSEWKASEVRRSPSKPRKAAKKRKKSARKKNS